jgi:sugar phosphate isomerase/epimerase
VTTSPPPFSFEAVAHQFRQRGIIITSLPGAYSVNYLNGKPDSAETRETLREALELAEAMANEAPAAAARSAAGYRPKRRLSMRPKAIIKRRIKAHNRRLRARAIRA